MGSEREYCERTWCPNQAHPNGQVVHQERNEREQCPLVLDGAVTESLALVAEQSRENRLWVIQVYFLGEGSSYHLWEDRPKGSRASRERLPGLGSRGLCLYHVSKSKLDETSMPSAASWCQGGAYLLEKSLPDPARSCEGEPAPERGLPAIKLDDESPPTKPKGGLEFDAAVRSMGELLPEGEVERGWLGGCEE